MIKILRNQCIGCGLCVSLCPDVFTMDETYKAMVVSEKNINCAKNAANSCPVEAIIVR